MFTTTRLALGASAAAILLTAAPALAQLQDPRPNVPRRDLNRPPQQQVQPGQQAQQRTALRPQAGNSTLADQEIASWLTLCNEMEVQISQFAEKKATDKQIRQFADKMVKEHSDVANQYRQFAPNAPTLANQPQQQQTSQRTQPVVQGQGGQHGLPIVEISHQLAQRGLQSVRKELSQKEGKEFDHAFAAIQHHEHQMMLDTLEVLRPYASQQLAGVIDQSIQSTQKHLAEAKQLCEDLKGERASEQKTGELKNEDSQD